MTKGTPSMGKHGSKKQHIPCRRCGKSSFNVVKGVCASCDYGKSPRLRSYSWAKRH